MKKITRVFKKAMIYNVGRFLRLSTISLNSQDELKRALLIGPEYLQDESASK